MKFLIITTAALLIVLSLPGQNIPNSDMESWTYDGTFENPNNWDCSNRSFFGIVVFNPVTKETTNPYHGSTCAKLETVSKLYGGETIKVAGVITLGIFDIDIPSRKAWIKGGIPFSQRPARLRGYYKYLPVDNDLCDIRISLTKFNTGTQQPDTVGYGRLTSSAQSNWTLFEINVQYSSTQAPDTMNIVAISSDTSIFKVGSTLWIDSLTLDGQVDILEIQKMAVVSLFPNPVSGQLNIIADRPFDAITIYNPEGEIVLTRNTGECNRFSLDLSVLQAGSYYLALMNEEETVHSEKIIVF